VYVSIWFECYYIKIVINL